MLLLNFDQKELTTTFKPPVAEPYPFLVEVHAVMLLGAFCISSGLCHQLGRNAQENGASGVSPEQDTQGIDEAIPASNGASRTETNGLSHAYLKHDIRGVRRNGEAAFLPLTGEM